MTNVNDLSQIGFAIGGGFLVGVLIGYALKKVLKLVAVVGGLFFAGIAYLQYQHILNINWIKLEVASQRAVSTLTNASTQVPGLGTSHTVASLGIPLTGSMSMGFTIGFMKG